MIHFKRSVAWVIFFVGMGSGLSYGYNTEMLAEDLSQVRQAVSRNRDEHRLIADLEEGLKFYESLSDYKAVFYKAERSGEALGETEKIYLKFEKPWKIYMGWLNTPKKGLQVVYEKGHNDGKLVVHKPGLLLGLAPVLFLDQDSPWVKEGSASYHIEDAGLGSFLFDFTRAVVRAARENKLKVVYHGASKNGPSTGERMEVTFLGSQEDEDYFAYRIYVVFDRMSHLPLEMQLFDWENQLIGSYAYRDFEYNVGENEEFKQQIDRHLLKVYSHQNN